MKSARINILKYYFKNLSRETLSSVLKTVFQIPAKYRLKKYVEKIIVNKGLKYIYFRNIEKPLIVPADLHDLNITQVVLEQFDMHNWHRYDCHGTEVEKDDIVVDCGAAEGLFTFLNFTKCRKIYAIEPVQSFVDSLHLNFDDSDTVEIISDALGLKKGTAELVDEGIASYIVDSQTKNSITVNVNTLDNIFYKSGINITYLKGDLEGQDLNVLIGAEKLIRKCKPKIAFTIYHNIDHEEQMISFLKDIDKNYKIITRGIYSDTGAKVMLHAHV